MSDSAQVLWSRRRRDFTPEERQAFGVEESGTVRDLWIEIELADGWRAAFRLVAHEGEPAPAEVRVFPADDYPGREPGHWRAETLGVRAASVDSDGPSDGPKFPGIGRGITAQLLRDVPLRVVQQHARRIHEEMSEHVRAARRWASGVPDGIKVHTEVEDLGFSVAVESRRRADAWDERRYARLAAAYIGFVEGGSRSPVSDVAEEFELSPAQVRDALHRARHKLGILTRAPRRGVAGGQLTPYGESLLDQSDGGNDG